MPLRGRDDLGTQYGKINLKNLSLSLSLSWIQGPFGDPTLESAIELNFLDTKGFPVDLPNDVELVHYSFMPSMGHGPADEGYVVQIDTGLYQIQEIYYSMPGDWTLTLEFKRAGEKIDETSLNLFL